MKLSSIVGLALWAMSSALAAEPIVAPRTEVIDLSPKRLTFDDRPSFLVAIDERVRSFDETRDLMLQWLKTISFKKATISNLEALEGMKPEEFTVVCCFGRAASLLSSGKYAPAEWYIIAPNIEPPTVSLSAPVAVLLADGFGYSKGNGAWIKWCKSLKMPWALANVREKPLVERSLHNLSEKITVIRREKESLPKSRAFGREKTARE